MSRPRNLTTSDFQWLKRNDYFKSENGYTESGTYTVNALNEVYFNYYFNDGNVIERQDFIGRIIE